MWLELEDYLTELLAAGRIWAWDYLGAILIAAAVSIAFLWAVARGKREMRVCYRCGADGLTKTLRQLNAREWQCESCAVEYMHRPIVDPWEQTGTETAEERWERAMRGPRKPGRTYEEEPTQ